jgi:hypothetical protein
MDNQLNDYWLREEQNKIFLKCFFPIKKWAFRRVDKRVDKMKIN